MPKIKSMADISEKWARVTPQRGTDYEAGIRNPRDPWAAATQAAAANYAGGVQAAVAGGRFQKGVAAAGDQKWQQNALAKGPGRFAEGVALAQPDYEQGFAPFAQVIQSTNLPPRRPKGDPTNIQRVAVMAQAMRAKAVGK